jgi:hypothetical protein
VLTVKERRDRGGREIAEMYVVFLYYFGSGIAMHPHRRHLSSLHTLWRSKYWVKIGAELAIVKWCETLENIWVLWHCLKMGIMRSILHQLHGCVEMRGIGRYRGGTCGVAGYLVEGKQKKFRGLHYCGSPRMCLSRNLFVCDTEDPVKSMENIGPTYKYGRCRA